MSMTNITAVCGGRPWRNPLAHGGCSLFTRSSLGAFAVSVLFTPPPPFHHVEIIEWGSVLANLRVFYPSLKV